VLSPAQLKAIVTSNSELRLLREKIGETEELMMDGYWEVDYTLRKREIDVKRLVDQGVGEAERVQVEAYFDALQGAVDNLGERGVKGVRCMDFWAGVFGR
jgi:hypothetical protein